jgi:NAD(P)H-dependent nitrite reductase small subunit
MEDFKEEGFQNVCSLNQLKDREGKRFIVNDVDIAVFKVDDEVYALSNICPHQHTALIYDGFIENEYITCPVHGWMFSLKTGKTPSCTNGLDYYDVKIIDDQVYVRVMKKRMNW